MKTSKVQVKIFYEILLANKTLLKVPLFVWLLFLSAFSYTKYERRNETYKKLSKESWAQISTMNQIINKLEM